MVKYMRSHGSKVVCLSDKETDSFLFTLTLEDLGSKLDSRVFVFHILQIRPEFLKITVMHLFTVVTR